ncbi:MAG TPA: 1,4-alpha-glucan branching protein domain-containing protein [Pyrinomonadaceae bacterium]|nr:1,4-alpha-glucan branching protein domain-containing protein [Pyrinomonadaceae bacterium]
MPTGYFSLILHAHLPFVRHPEYPEFLEEDWLYEAITEVYLPLIFIFQNLHEAGAKPRLAMNVSPPLCEMLADKLLETRYTEHLEQLVELADKELHRTKTEAQEFVDVVQMYVDNLTASLDLWNNRYKRNLINAFRELQEEGVLEIITCGATHGFLPLISTQEARRAQIEVAVNNYKKHFSRSPRGIWLPECAYEPGIEDLLKDAGIEYFISDTHAILYGDPRPRYGVHAPVVCPNGTAVFARDVETSQQVWSAEVGYPGSDVYREFYRDIGWDLPLDYLKPYLHSDGERKHLGLKYHRITGRDVPQQNKLPYIPALAREKAAENAMHFIGERIKQARILRDTFDGHPPLVVSPYDAELYGHWWYEGPQFIDFFFRKLHWDQDDIAAITPGDFLDSGIPIQIQQPTASSWGENGYYKVWLNDRNSWMYPYQHDAERRMTELANKFAVQSSEFRVQSSESENSSNSEPGTLNSELVTRLLNQLARELLLAQSSDWAFQIYQGTTVEYSSRRFQSHIQRFDLIAKMLDKLSVPPGLAGGSTLPDEDMELLAEIENRDNIFQEIDYRIYKS